VFSSLRISFNEESSFYYGILTNVQARIDSHNKILYARHADQRKATFQRVLQTGVEFEREVKSMLLRANLVKHEISAKSVRKF
jgi:COP9 signalosome complex subunit 1